MSFTFESIVQNLGDAIFLFDKKERLVFLNKAAEEFIGKDYEELLNKKTKELFHKKDIVLLIKKTIKEGRPFNYRDMEFDENNSINIDISCYPFYTYHNQKFKGLTEIEGALLCIKEKPLFTKKEDSQFDSLLYILGSIAHEIKNPLSGIKGAAQILKKISQNSEAEECTNLILKESERLNSVLNNYLTMTKKPVFHKINIHEILEQAIIIMKSELKKNKITVNRLYDLSLPLLSGDEGKLLQVFINLMKNSIDAMKISKNRCLKIFTKPSDEYMMIYEDGLLENKKKIKKQRFVLIGIEDTGVGIAKSDINKIFLPFYTKKKDGTGLGLAISKRIINDHGGMIKVKSNISKGSTFSIYIPISTNNDNL
jgi:two-component system nitrogen regulation sensor histidine kinase GlnL